MAKIKRKIIKDFTTVQNDFLRDTNLGISERGLLITMLSLPNGWDFSAVGLASILPDGERKTNTSLRKLEGAGYLKRSRLYDSKGKIVDWLYEFCDGAIFKDKKPYVQNVHVDNAHVDDVHVDNAHVDNEHVQSSHNNQIYIELNTKELNDIFNQSMCQSKQAKERVDKSIVTGDMIDQIRKDIGADKLMDIHKLNTDEIAFAVDIIAELRSAKGTVKIGKSEFDSEYVRQVAKTINCEHIQYVFECIHTQNHPIKNIRAYLRTAIFYAPISMINYKAHIDTTWQRSFDVDEFFKAAVAKTLREKY